MTVPRESSKSAETEDVAMAPGEQQQLVSIVARIVETGQGPLSLPDIEQRLARDPSAPQHVDTFDVRDAIWQLITQGRLRFTPRRQVTVAE